MQLVVRQPPNADRRIAPERRRLRPDGVRTGGKNSPCLRNPALWLVSVVEERVDGGFDGGCQGCGHIRRRQLAADRQRALQRLAGGAAVMALREMCPHRRAHARIDLAFIRRVWSNATQQRTSTTAASWACAMRNHSKREVRYLSVIPRRSPKYRSGDVEIPPAPRILFSPCGSYK